MSPSDRAQFKGGAFRLDAEIHGCEPEIMKAVGWLWPWPFEVRVRKETIAVCLDYVAAAGAVCDYRNNSTVEKL
jgi:hypothetical protein